MLGVNPAEQGLLNSFFSTFPAILLIVCGSKMTFGPWWALFVKFLFVLNFLISNLTVDSAKFR